MKWKYYLMHVEIRQMNLTIYFSNVGPKLAKDITNPDKNMSTYDYLGSRIEKMPVPKTRR